MFMMHQVHIHVYNLHKMYTHAHTHINIMAYIYMLNETYVSAYVCACTDPSNRTIIIIKLRISYYKSYYITIDSVNISIDSLLHVRVH